MLSIVRYLISVEVSHRLYIYVNELVFLIMIVNLLKDDRRYKSDDDILKPRS